MKLLARILPAAAGLIAAIGAAQASEPALSPALQYQAIPGVTPEPIAERAGLKSREDLENFLDGVIGAQMRAQHAAGVMVAVVKDGQLLLAKGYGYADVDKKIPVDAAKTLFRPGSVSKLFTWTALMQLIEQGKVKLDGDVNQYVTQFKVPDTYAGQPITVRNLFTHTEGMEDNGLGFLITKDATSLAHPAEVLAAHIPARVRPPAGGDWTNGDMSSYSNWGTALAGLIVANVSGMSYEDYVDQNVLAPLGMSHSTSRQPLPPALAPNMSNGYEYEQAHHKANPFEIVNLAPAGSMSVTAEDMARFMIAHLSGGANETGRVLKPETEAMMQSRALSPNPYVNGACLGFYEDHINGRRIIAHGGDTNFFHSELTMLPDEHVGIFYSVNTAPTIPFSARTDLVNAFMDRYYPARVPALKPLDGFKERAAGYAGRYRIIRHSYKTLEKALGLALEISVAPSERNTLVISVGSILSADWTEVKPGVFRRTDGSDMIAFSSGPDGKPAYLLNPLSLPNHPAYKLGWYETQPMLLLVLVFGLLCCVLAVVSALRNWGADAAAPQPSRARRLAGLVGVLNLAFFIEVVVLVVGLTKDPLGQLPGSFKIALALPLLAAAGTLGVIWYGISAWRGGWWTRGPRLHYTVVALGFISFLWLLDYANLIGYHLS